MGCAPAGPAGTGKTESTKDLASALGKACYVFNCSDQMDYQGMAGIFKGLAASGSWGCFDEFNRIEAEVLSVVSSQIKQIQEALKHNLSRFQFEGKEINCDARTGIFITMNPGYAGRTELPDNLKALFRPVTMIVPDLEQICEIMLFSEGFNAAKALAKKMTILYRLAKEQLSKRSHYDFGLRALKSVLVMAGALKRDAPELDVALQTPLTRWLVAVPHALELRDGLAQKLRVRGVQLRRIAPGAAQQISGDALGLRLGLLQGDGSGDGSGAGSSDGPCDA